MHTIKTRLKVFRSRIPRIHALRSQRIDTRRLVKAMSGPSILYGIDVVGASCTQLHRVRTSTLRAALPPGASRNVDVAFAVLDAGGAALDPAYSAHTIPLRHWGMAFWQDWVPMAEILAVFDAVHVRLQAVVARWRSVWHMVRGPSAAVIASAWRLGWTCESARIFHDDLGEQVDFLTMSPALVSATVHRSVARWRLRRVARALPTLVAEAPDLPGQPNVNSFTVLVGRPLSLLSQGKGQPTATVPQWTPACRAQLLSAATGGQWPQVRIAKLNGTTAAADHRCQLCRSAPGTLLHRRQCQASLPPGGWPPPPTGCEPLLRAIGDARRELLQTRGLLALRIPRPPLQTEVGFRWYTAPPDVTRTDLTWYTDGSMKFGPQWELRRTGCAIVVVSAAGDLIAYGSAVPPAWVRTAAAAELWAVTLVLSLAAAPPEIRTDCRSILTAAAAGSARATRPTGALAQLWSRIATLLDDNVYALIETGKLIWMPAHSSQSAIGRAVRSDGHFVTPLDWRANRLADAIAKAAAGCDQVCVDAVRLLAKAEQLVAHECAVLGSVTFAANHNSSEVTGHDGIARTVIARDAAALRRPRKLAKPAEAPALRQATLPVSADHARAATTFAVATRHPSVVARAASARTASRARVAAEVAMARALCCSRMATARPSSAPPAAERLAAVRQRVLARCTAA